MSRRTADLAIVGAGASAAHTLLALVKELSSPMPAGARPARVVIIDRDPQFFSGVAYGNRSGRGSLTLSTLNGFLGDEERVRFVSWLESHDDAIQRTADPAWRDRHLADITDGRWGELFIPRRLYGEYLSGCVRAAMNAAQSAGVAEFTLLTADVTSIDRSDGRLLVTAMPDDGRAIRIDTAVVVLATGSPPTRRLRADDAAADGLIHDIYDPGLDVTLARLHGRLRDLPVHGRRVLVVGGNAAALEFVSASHADMRDLQARISVLSPSGRPRHWRRRGDDEVAELAAMDALRIAAASGERVTAAMLYEAAADDLRAAVDSATDVAAVRDIVASIPFFLDLLHDDDRAALAARYGLAITNLLRQDCGDAVDVLESSVATGAVGFSAGRFSHCRTERGYFRVTTKDVQGRESLLDECYGAIVGATGFETVSDTRAPLIRHLLRAGIVDASSSAAGLRVDSQFRAAPGVFVVGPLLAGNAHPNMLIWHAESVRRIMAIAPMAGSCIARELRALAAGSAPFNN